MTFRLRSIEVERAMKWGGRAPPGRGGESQRLGSGGVEEKGQKSGGADEYLS